MKFSEIIKEPPLLLPPTLHVSDYGYISFILCTHDNTEYFSRNVGISSKAYFRTLANIYDVFRKKCQLHLVINYFYKNKLHHRCLTGS